MLKFLSCCAAATVAAVLTAAPELPPKWRTVTKAKLTEAHQVADSIAWFYVKVEISLHTACMCVRRHCVPYRTWEKLGKTHLKLVCSASLNLSEY